MGLFESLRKSSNLFSPTLWQSTPYNSKEFFIYMYMIENISQNLVEEFINDVIIENYEIEF